MTIPEMIAQAQMLALEPASIYSNSSLKVYAASTALSLAAIAQMLNDSGILSRSAGIPHAALQDLVIDLQREDERLLQELAEAHKYANQTLVWTLLVADNSKTWPPDTTDSCILDYNSVLSLRSCDYVRKNPYDYDAHYWQRVVRRRTP